MNDQIQAIILGVVRHAVTALGAYLATDGISLTGSQTETMIGAIMVVISLGFSWAQKVWQARAARTGAVAAAVESARQGTPVTVTVTPVGQPNIATKVSRVEQAAAPTVPAGAIPQPAPLTI